jgi:hypothetical protein
LDVIITTSGIRKTPAEKDDTKVECENKWITLMQNVTE